MLSFLFTIGVICLAFKLASFVWKAAWGITKGVFLVLGLPIILIVLFVAGLVYLALPLLLISIIGAFVFPALKS